MRGWDARVAAFRGRGGDHDEVVIPSPPRIVTHMQSILAAGSASASVKLSSSGRGGDAVAGETGRKPEAAPSLGDGQSVGGVLSDLGLGLGVGMDGLDGAGYASSFPMMGFEANLLFDDTSMGDPAAAAGAAAAAASAGGGFAQFGEATGASATDLYDDFVAPSALLRPTEADVNQLNWATLGWSLGDGRSG
ncbi:hypothetical protein VTK73DRAFT_9322 [Phialemonium thermophilum]|uniref:Uncharacterized protein n=1 Tax=Phialemonium thermophilum TaxID=223376 RepID=A0ABR3W3P8_9PEZI